MAALGLTNQDGFRLTGRMVLFGLIGFFGLIFAANAVLIWFAVSTNTGIVVSSSYRVGGAYQSDIDAAREQAARNWSVTADIFRAGSGAALGATIDIAVRDAAGAPIPGLSLTARLASPMSEGTDAVMTLSEGEVGRYRGAVDAVAPGNWMLTIDADRDEARVYHSENRVLLR